MDFPVFATLRFLTRYVAVSFTVFKTWRVIHLHEPQRLYSSDRLM
jgi:hypothetical protein